MSTYTQVFYFSPGDDCIDELNKLIEEMVQEFTTRVPFMHPRAQIAGKERLEVLRAAAHMLVEPLPRSFGG